MYGMISDPGMRHYPPRVALAPEPEAISNQPVGLGFPHPAGRHRPGDHLFRPRCVGFEYVWKGF